MRVDGLSYHDRQKRDLQVSKKGWLTHAKGLKIGKEGSKGGSAKRAAFMEVLVRINIYCSRVFFQLMNIVFRL
jgi:hypothetical protein